MRKSDGRSGTSTMNRDGDGEIKFMFDDGEESRYTSTRDLWVLADNPDSGWPVLTNSKGMYCYRRESLDRWCIGSKYEPSKDAALAMIVAAEGPLPVGDNNWTCHIDGEWVQRTLTLTLQTETAEVDVYRCVHSNGIAIRAEPSESADRSHGPDAGETIEVACIILAEADNPQAAYLKLADGRGYCPIAARGGEQFFTKVPAAEAGRAHNCPGGHGLAAGETQHSGFYCDICRSSLPAGARVLSCRQCDFDVCGTCASSGSGGGVVQIAWDTSKHGKGTKVKRKSDGRTGVSTRNRDSDGEIKIRFDDDGSESGYINTSNVWVLVTTTPSSTGATTLATSRSPEASTASHCGVYFDVRSEGPAVRLTAISGGGHERDRRVTIYVCDGSSSGRETSRGAWREVGAGTLNGDRSTRVALSSPVAVGAGATVGLFVHTTSGKGVNYSTQGAVGAVDASDGTISVLKGKVTTDERPFTRLTDQGWALAGSVEYEVAGGSGAAEMATMTIEIPGTSAHFDTSASSRLRDA